MARPTPHFFISAPSLPGAKFASVDALRTHCHNAIAIEKTLNDFAADGCEPALWEEMRDLGFDTDEIAGLLANRTSRPACGYMMAGDAR